MVLSFSRAHKDRVPTNFRQQIQDLGSKVHTIRAGKRWRPGDIIHFWDGSPRLKGSIDPDPEEFFIDIDSRVGKKIPLWSWDPESDPDLDRARVRVPIVEDIEIYSIPGQILPTVYIGGLKLSDSRIGILASRDGLTIKQFTDWFSAVSHFEGQIIHWTNTLIYNEEKAQKSDLLDEADKIEI